MLLAQILMVALACLASADTDDRKWVWSAARRSGGGGGGGEDRVYTGVASNSGGNSKAFVSNSESLFRPASAGESVVPQSTRLRYEVTQPEYPDLTVRPTNEFPQENLRPPRPTGSRPDFINNNNNNNNYNRPVNTESYRPINRPSGGYRPEESYRPRPSYRPQGAGLSTGLNGRPILTGSVPSWEHRGQRYQDYDRCKCVHSFNCNSPGIQFGSCDTDKKYCCYKEDYNNFNNNNYRPNRPVDIEGSSRPVLAGPNGPRDTPSYYRPGNADRFDGPDRYSNNRYPKDYRGVEETLEEAYKRGLESAIHETIHTLTGINTRDLDRDYSRDRDFNRNRDFNRDRDYRIDSLGDFNRRPSQGGKYGLYQPNDYYGGRAANTTILSEKNVKRN